MLMFREEKSPEDEIKAWQFWHGRQHSVKQRILDAGNVLDTHIHPVGCIRGPYRYYFVLRVCGGCL